VRAIDLTIQQGATWSRGWSVTVDGDPLPDAWTVRAQARTAPGGDLLADWSTDPGEGQLTAENVAGVVKLYATAEESAAWTWTVGAYDVFATSPDGSVRLKLVAGRINVVPEITETTEVTDA
jgi:hypothetical protein